MSREYGRGSIVSFIVVGVLLGAIVLGGLYLAKNQLADWINGLPAQDTELAVDDTSDQPTATDSEADDQAPADKGTNQTEDDDVTVDEAETTTDDTAVGTASDQSVESDVVEDDQADEADAAEQSVRESAATTDDREAIPTTGVEMPQTGAADSLFTVTPVIALVAAGIAYRRSTIL